MSTKAPPRGALLGRSYLCEEDAIRVIRDLQDGIRLFNFFFARLPDADAQVHRITRTEAALLRVVRELEDALGSSADG